MLSILDGVFQGSVLGPFIFNIFVNDIFMFVKNSEVAVDISLTRGDVNINIIINKLEAGIKIPNSWG